MDHSIRLNEVIATTPWLRPDPGSVSIHPLREANRSEALSILKPNSIDSLIMSSLIQDNGLESELNRGSFYGARNAAGRLEGIALIGHATLVETHLDAALRKFAQLAQQCPRVHVMLGAHQKIQRFWGCYKNDGRPPRRTCRELLFEQRSALDTGEIVPLLRRAATDDLLDLLSVNARMAFEESGVNPLAADPNGFASRLARRIEDGRVWLWRDSGRLIFKADIIARTPKLIYVEGVYVHPAERHKGYGLRCMSQLGRILLSQAQAIYLLANEQNKISHQFFVKAGYKQIGSYDTLFV
jgi:uncharacterized protein